MITKIIHRPQRFINKKSQKFFSNRIPKADNVTLGLKNVYIFFSKEGMLFGVLLLITFIAGVNYGNNLVLGFSFYLGSIWLISLHLTFSHISGLEFRLLHITLTEAGSPAWVTFQITNHASKPSRQLSLHFDHSEYREEYQLNDNELPIASISTKVSSINKQHILKLPVITSKRGKMTLPRLSVSTVYPLGIMRAWAYIYFSSPAWVYPKALAFEWNPHNQSANEETKFSQFQEKGQNDFDMLNEYQEGESLARVSWQHFARGHGMLTKHFCDTVGQELTLDYQEMPSSNHEQKLQQLTFALKSVSEGREDFALSLPNDKGDFGQGQAFEKSCLLRLAQTP